MMRITAVASPPDLRHANRARSQRRTEARIKTCEWCGETFQAKTARKLLCDNCGGNLPYTEFVCLDGEGQSGKCLHEGCECGQFDGTEDVCQCGHPKYSPADRNTTSGHDHKYVLLGVGDRQLWHDDCRPLQWGEIFAFLYGEFRRHPPATVFAGFVLGYDFNQWFKTLPWDRAATLLNKNDRNFIKRHRTRSGKNHQPFPVSLTDPDTGQQWQIDIHPNGKLFRLRPKDCDCTQADCIHQKGCYHNCPFKETEGKSHVHSRGVSWMYINDTGPFFQTAFINVINPADWKEKVITDEEFEIITTGKDERSNAVLNEDMRRYNALENEILARVLSRLDKGFRDIGIILDKKHWYGPGAVAAQWMEGKAPKSWDLKEGSHKDVLVFALNTYYAGWFELFIHGLIRGITWEYDINSAYPHRIRSLPCLGSKGDHGKWKRFAPRSQSYYRKELPALRQGQLCMAHASVKGDNPHIGTMMHRTIEGRLLRPHRTSGWYWTFELQAAMDAGLISDIVIDQMWTFTPTCKCPPPLAEVESLYDQRLKVGKKTPMGKGAKLTYNAMSGKFAQSAGAPKRRFNSETGKYEVEKGEDPPCNNWIWASLITAGCRTQILEAIATHPGPACEQCQKEGRPGGPCQTAMVATDGVYFLSEHPGLPVSTKLGDWECNEHSNLTLFKPGVYWDDDTRDDLRNGRTPHLKTRGVSAKAFAKVIEDADAKFNSWTDPVANINGRVSAISWPSVRFALGFAMVTAKQALTNDVWELAGHVSNRSVTFKSNPTELKRTLGGYDPQFGVYRTKPRPDYIQEGRWPWISKYESEGYRPELGVRGEIDAGFRDPEAAGINANSDTLASEVAEMLNIKH